MKDTLVLGSKDVFKVLYYETGFEQLHPFPEIVYWMKDQGYEYHEDWRVEHHPSVDYGEPPYYCIIFPNTEIMTLFSLRWLLKDAE